jgi:hypothetical protein
MRRICAAGVSILVMIGSNGCLFEPRTAEEPSGSDLYPWVVPYVFENVLRNLTTGLASNVDSNYQRSLDDAAFTFIPTDADAINVGPEKFVGWNKAVESEWLRRIKTLYLGARTLRFGDASGNFTSKIEQVNRVVLEGEYEIGLEPTPGDPKEVYAGIARFTLVRGTLGWVMAEWRDLEASGTNPTSGYLRGTLRQ